MADTAHRRATYDDILALPENVVGEILGGVLHTQPRPRWAHARAAINIGYEIVGPFGRGKGGPGGWVFAAEAELHLGENILVPDLSGWRAERAPADPDKVAIEIPPDWVCEILSPSTAQKDRAIKADYYAQSSIEYMWLVDPASKTLEAFKLTGGKWLLLKVFKEDDLVAAEPFDAAPFKLDTLWV